MATMVLGAAGGAVGTSLGGGILGLSSAAVGRAAGGMAGRLIDAQLSQKILGAGGRIVEHGRIDRLRLTSAGEGAPIPQVFGRMRIAGHVIWASKFVERVSETAGGAGGKGARTAATADRTYSYEISLAIGLCEGPIAGIGRVWADGRELVRESLDLRVYAGHADQLSDPAIEAVEGAGAAPAYRGLAYVVIENLALGTFGNRVPQFSFEVVRNEGEEGAGDVAQHVRGVALIPGTGEYSIATTPVRYDDGADESAFVNAHVRTGRTDMAASIQALTTELPRCGALSLVVSWFGDDLRCGVCSLKPKVEALGRDGVEIAWRSGGIGHRDAEQVPQQDGRVAYGGTPADGAVIEAIRAATEAGQEVMFYPFILMDQLPGNGLPDPYGWSEQPALPWRGRITCDVAPGHDGSPDGTAAVDADVMSFFGAAASDDFQISGGEVHYHGPDEWSFRRMILHYAHVCAVAGGVESFCIGSEMRGLTTLRGTDGFPAVRALKALAADVRGILGPEVKIGYAADWSEYFGYHPADGSGDLFFHLDPLWSDPNIDFVGIDNYMPLSDWRGEHDEADSAYQGPHDLDYLKANIEGGEGFDWYYGSDADRLAQLRRPITDGAYDEPWVWRYKDIRNWWSSPHHDRIGGLRQPMSTPWEPGSKPIRFTEMGCAAIDKGTNQPNKFLDPKSSESALPWFSDGARDDFVQVQYLRAMDEYWGDPERNPVSATYARPMVDMRHAYAWAWDARPFPAFPGLPDVWSDAENYYRGHWLTGRSGYRTLASVVSEICHRAGVRTIDVTRLRGMVRGYAVTEVTDARAVLQPLMLAYGFDAVERDGVLRFSMRRTDGAVALDQADVVAADGGDVVTVRDPEVEEAGRVSVGYVVETGDFPAGVAEAVVPGTDDTSLARVELPLVLSPSEARGIAERWLAEAQAGRDRISFALPPSRFDLGAGDVVSMQDALWRIDRVAKGAALQVEAVRIAAGRSLVAAGGALEDGIAVAPAVLPTPPVALFMDLPVLDGEGDAVPRIAVGAKRWPGPVAVLSSVEDAGYALDTTVVRGAVMGVTETALAHAAPGRVDRGPALRVRLLSGALASVSDAAFAAGANAMAIGSGEDDLWEVFQFRDAELVGTHRWTLSHRLRGQAGTDAVMPAVWPAGSRVVLLDAALVPLHRGAAQPGLERHWRIGPADQPLDGPSFTHAVRGFEGIGLRPYSPVHLGFTPNGGDLQAKWIRRTRINGDSWSGREVALGEETEAYLVRVMRGTNVVREVEVATPAWNYAAAMRASDGSGCRLEVAQLSRAFGAGPTVALALPDP
ncbi:Putative phage tail protein [Palleronia marisminoris]|uniref:Phage tail protein n=1 Tax=Palleronia marisminoris TaxID=315423 RepID=A0A1Y5RKL3_9RHOB|nr:glycoside hydrolase/phage tail family protein [Palleronia marisminoris]SFG18483.1 Putative phage tail protein [Palleronia marisminoris]SLN16942.1 hypothetical protein PAM7066_00435 [Palleronia marisminoris]